MFVIDIWYLIAGFLGDNADRLNLRATALFLYKIINDLELENCVVWKRNKPILGIVKYIHMLRTNKNGRRHFSALHVFEKKDYSAFSCKYFDLCLARNNITSRIDMRRPPRKLQLPRNVEILSLNLGMDPIDYPEFSKLNVSNVRILYLVTSMQVRELNLRFMYRLEEVFLVSWDTMSFDRIIFPKNVKSVFIEGNDIYQETISLLLFDGENTKLYHMKNGIAMILS